STTGFSSSGKTVSSGSPASSRSNWSLSIVSRSIRMADSLCNSPMCSRSTRAAVSCASSITRRIYGSTGSIGYAEFRHLGKENVLGRYSIHFHLIGDSMRGASVIGASIWDSGNRWITIHGTNYLVVRDCVGYQSVGHGYFLEDGTEVFNVLDHNLAVQA